MTDIRESLGWIVGSLIAGIGAFLSWFYESGLLATVAGIIIGVLVTDFVQKRTQKRTWKREYSIKVVEQVYGELFGTVKGFIELLTNKDYSSFSFSTWQRIQNDHRYFMVDNEFRKKLDGFSERITNYSIACGKLQAQIIPRILRSAAQEILHKTTQDTPRLSFHYTINKQRHSVGFLTESRLKNLETLSDISEAELRYVDKSQVSDKFFDRFHSDRL